MKLENYGYKERTQKIRKMTMAEMRIGIAQYMFENELDYTPLRVINTTTADVECYSTVKSFIKAEFNESYEVNFVSLKAYGDCVIVVFEETED